MKYNKKQAKATKAEAKLAGVKTVVVPPRACAQGFVVAYMPTVKGGKMIRVAVSYCSDEDDFKPKRGKFFARERLLSGECIQLPLGNVPEWMVESTLAEVFTM